MSLPKFRLRDVQSWHNPVAFCHEAPGLCWTPGQIAAGWRALGFGPGDAVTAMDIVSAFEERADYVDGCWVIAGEGLRDHLLTRGEAFRVALHMTPPGVAGVERGSKFQEGWDGLHRRLGAAT